MTRDDRILGLPLRRYALLLAALGTVAFLGGAIANFVHARNTPGVDPYLAPPVTAPR